MSDNKLPELLDSPDPDDVAPASITQIDDPADGGTKVSDLTDPPPVPGRRGGGS